MAIKQFKADYFPAEDRILFRFNTDKAEEYKLWLTRRLTIFFLNATNYLIKRQLERGHSPDTTKAIASFQKEVIKETTSFEANFINGESFPIGSDPILVADIKCSSRDRADAAITTIEFKFHNRESLTLSYSQKTLQIMYLLLERIEKEAKWGFGNTPRDDVDQTTETEANISQKKLHPIH